jgi:hypothetical protein
MTPLSIVVQIRLTSWSHKLVLTANRTVLTQVAREGFRRVGRETHMDLSPTAVVCSRIGIARG